MAKWEPQKGAYARGALAILNAYVKGVFGYPEVTLKLAGEEANASRQGRTDLKNAIHQVVEAIRSVSEPYRTKRGFHEDPVYYTEPQNPPAGEYAVLDDEARSVVDRAIAMLASYETNKGTAMLAS